RWDAPAGSPDLQDVKTIPGSRVVVAAAGKELVVLDVSSGAIVEIARAACPIADVNLFRRVQVREVDGRVLAFAIAALDSPVLPRKSSLVIADLDREHGYAQPLFFAQDW